MSVNLYEPMVPLPGEGAGLPIDDAGNAVTGGTAVIPLPDENAGLPIDDAGNAVTGGTPVIPLPDEGAGLPIDDAGNAVLGPNRPRAARVRFLHAAYGFGTIDHDVPFVERFTDLPAAVDRMGPL